MARKDRDPLMVTLAIIGLIIAFIGIFLALQRYAQAQPPPTHRRVWGYVREENTDAGISGMWAGVWYLDENLEIKNKLTRTDATGKFDLGYIIPIEENPTFSLEAFGLVEYTANLLEIAIDQPNPLIIYVRRI